MIRSLFSGNLSFEMLLIMVISYLVIVMVTMPVHEFAHAFVATKLGDPTAKWNGRLTLNPAAHLDWIGTAMLVLFGFGYAKPVPVNPSYFKNPKAGMALTALAGPVANLLVALVAASVCRITLSIAEALPSTVGVMYWLWQVFTIIALVNISLAVFNLLPIPPLDGFRIITPLLPDRWVYFVNRNQIYVTGLVMLLIVTNVLDRPLGYLISLFQSLIFGLFGLT